MAQMMEAFGWTRNMTPKSLFHRNTHRNRAARFAPGVFLATGAVALAIDSLAMWWGKHKGDLIAGPHAATAFQVANAIEAGLWIVMGLCIFIVAVCKSAMVRGSVAAITLIVFGCSDIVEMQTRAWWRPWWLLLWKLLCVLVLTVFLVDCYLRSRRKAPLPN